MIKKINPYWVITLSVCIGIIAYPLFQYGMFMDGVQYACVSKNLANGLGSFWQPFLSPVWNKAGSNYFLEHPPLVYFLQSIFFKIFGNVFYVERLYCLFTAFITIYLIHLFWKQLFIQNQIIAKYSWLPVLLWIIIPLNFWGYHNNIQENTMGVFVLLAALFALKAINNNSKQYFFILLAGLSVFFATLCKGLPGLFPLSFFIVYWITNKSLNLKKAILFSFFFFIIPSIVYLIIIQDKTAYDSLHFYITKRLLYRINNEPTVENRFSILWQTIMESLHVIILSLLALGWQKFKRKNLSSDDSRKIIFLLLFGLCGIAPMMLTPTQRVFYVTPAMPFIVMALAIIISSFISNKIYLLNKYINSLRIFSIITLCISILFVASQYGKYTREKEKFNDVFLIGNVVPRYSQIKIDDIIFEDWALQFYLIRYFDVYLNSAKSNDYQYCLQFKNDTTETDYKSKVILNTNLYDLYKEK